MDCPTDGGTTLGGMLVLAAYILMAVAMLWAIIQGFIQRSYGMPVTAIMMRTAITFLCGFIGPWQLPHLFEQLLCEPEVIWLWRFGFVMDVTVLIQYLVSRSSHPTFWPEYSKWAPLLLILGVIVTYIGVHTFVVFYQDYYVNEIWPIAMLVMAVGFLGTLFTRMKLRGLSMTVAVLWFLGNFCLYYGTYYNGLEHAYRNAEHGYSFIIWIYAVTLVLNLAYIIGLYFRRQELKADWDHNETIKRALPQAA